MTLLAPGLAAPAPLGECQACGAWSQGARCPDCGWTALVTPVAMSVAPPVLRVLFELVLQHNGVLRLAGVRCQRLPFLADSAELDQALTLILAETQPADDQSADWLALLSALQDHLEGHLGGLYGDGQVPRGGLQTVLRVAVHAPGRTLSALTGPRLGAVDFGEQMSRLGAGVAAQDLALDLGGLRFHLASDHWAGTVQLQPAVDLLVLGAAVLVGDADGEVLAELAEEVFCPAGERSLVDLPWPGAKALHAVSAAAGDGRAPDLVLALRVHGLAEPLRFPLPPSATSALPPADATADLLLDVGNRTTRLVLCLGQRPDQWIRRIGSTVDMMAAMGVSAPQRGAGGRAEWLAHALPRLADWAAERHHCFVADVVAVQGVVDGATAPVEIPADAQGLLGRCRVVAEHVALAAHLIPPLAGLSAGLAVFQAQRAKREARVAQAVAYNQKAKARREAAIAQFERSSGMSRMFSELTGDPRYARLPQARVPDALPALPDPMRRWLDRPERLGHVLAIDVGAESLERVFITDGVVIDAAGGSVPGVGGDVVSRQAGLWDGRDPAGAIAAAREKQRLRGSGDQDRRVDRLRQATLAVFAEPFQGVAAQARCQWADAPVLVVLGGLGGRDPFVCETLRTSLAEHSVDAAIVGSTDLADAAVFLSDHGMSGLGCEGLRRGLAWAGPMGFELAADPFNLIGGLMQLRNAQGVDRG